LVTRITFDAEYRLWGSSLCHLFPSPITLPL
jgi:hypothetical protein